MYSPEKRDPGKERIQTSPPRDSDIDAEDARVEAEIKDIKNMLSPATIKPAEEFHDRPILHRDGAWKDTAGKIVSSHPQANPSQNTAGARLTREATIQAAHTTEEARITARGRLHPEVITPRATERSANTVAETKPAEGPESASIKEIQRRVTRERMKNVAAIPFTIPLAVLAKFRTMTLDELEQISAKAIAIIRKPDTETGSEDITQIGDLRKIYNSINPQPGSETHSALVEKNRELLKVVLKELNKLASPLRHDQQIRESLTSASSSGKLAFFGEDGVPDTMQKIERYRRMASER